MRAAENRKPGATDQRGLTTGSALGPWIRCTRSAGADAGCIIVDAARVRIGKATMLGPHVQIYCAEHHKDVARRSEGLENAPPVEIGANV